MKAMLPITGWHRPARVPEAQLGEYRVRYGTMPVGTYDLNGVLGYLYFDLLARGRYTYLQERRQGRWCDWMTDQPLYWNAMGVYGQQAVGPLVLVGGLGLGLVLRHLAARTDLERIVVVERSAEVAGLVWEPLRKAGVLDARFELVLGDFFHLRHQLHALRFQTVITDFWVGEPHDPQVQELFLRTWLEVNRRWPKAQQFYHGVEPWARRLAAFSQAGVLGQLRHEQRIGMLADMARKED